MSNFDTTKKRLPDLLQDIVSGKIQLPDFQRGWVWGDQDIRSLLVSIARAFPVGAVMMLEAGGDTRFKVRPVEGLDPTKIKPEATEQLILDGQQRLTFLTQVLMLPQPVDTRTNTGKPLKRYYYINIELALAGQEHYENAIIGVDENRVIKENFGRNIKLDLSTPEKEYENFYFPCNRILNYQTWEIGLLACNDISKFKRYMDFREQFIHEFHKYNLPIIELSKENKKEAVCLVFEKVNTGGVALSVFELVTATYAADNVNLRDEWYGNVKDNIEGIHQKLSKQCLLRQVQPTEFLQALSLLYTWEKRQASSRYNSILNKTPISYKANRMIGGQAPSGYLNQLQNHRAVQLDDTGMNAILLTHSIDSTTLRKDDFEGFITARKQSLLAKIEAVIGKAIVLSDETVPEDESDDEDQSV